MQHIKPNVYPKLYQKRPHRSRVMNILSELLSSPFTAFGASQYSGEGVKLLAARGGSIYAHIACARYICIEQTSAVRNFFTNWLLKKKMQGSLDGGSLQYIKIFFAIVKYL